jgi:hypothetical protein
VCLQDGFSTVFSGCSFGVVAGVTFVLFFAIGVGFLVVAGILGRFGVSFLRGSPRSPEGRAWFLDRPDA